MTIKVIGDNPHSSVARQIICDSCGFVLEYVPNDIQEDYSSDCLGERSYYKFILCPKCNKQVRVRRNS